MPDLATNALIDVKEYLEMTGTPINDQDQPRDQIITHINAVSQMIEKYLGRVICPEQSKDDYFQGDNSDTYYVDHRYIASEAPTLYYWDGDEWVTMSVTDYPRETFGDKGKIWFSQGNVWDRKVHYKVAYTTGYANADAPGDIKLACMRLIQQSMMRANGKEGLRTESFGDSSTTYNFAAGWGMTAPSAIPFDIKALLAPYRRLTIG